MKNILKWLYCIWFGHSWKLIWKEEKGGFDFQFTLTKMVCRNCNKTVIIKRK